MVVRPMLCQRFRTGQSWWGNDLIAGGYLAAVHCRIDQLPPECRTDDHVVRRGYAVGFGPHGHWYFFDDIAPASAFGRAARMSLECLDYGIYHAAHELMHCVNHAEDERVLHLAGETIDRRADEMEHLERFVRGIAL